MERLQKVLANAGVASRRACEVMILAGRVSVNGQIVTELGTKVEPGRDAVSVDGKPLVSAPSPVYIMVNKPSGYVSTVRDPQGRLTVLDLVRAQDLPRLYPVGRLDADSEGLLLLTNDGALTLRMTHPSYEFEKEYLVWLDATPSASSLQRLRDGIVLDGKAAPVDLVEVLAEPSPERSQALLRFIIHEGRKRELRRLCLVIGHSVRRLKRVRMGPLKLGNLATGESRLLTAEEVAALTIRRPPAKPRSVAVRQPPSTHPGDRTRRPVRRPHAS